MSSALSLWESFIIMLVMILISIIATFVILMPFEEVNKQMTLAGVKDVPQEWQSSSNVDFYISAGYWLTYLVDFIAVGQFIWRSVKRQRYDSYGNLIYEE